MPSEQPQFLTVQDLARLLGCSTRTVWRHELAGKVPRGVRVGGIVRWPAAWFKPRP
jgi:predicted DNA-binding transcriptional regulator AlpA